MLIKSIDGQDGQCQSIHDIWDAAKKDPELNPETMMEEKKKELLDNLLQHRFTQTHAVRVSNLSAAQDVTHTVRRIEEAVSQFSISSADAVDHLQRQ